MNKCLKITLFVESPVTDLHAIIQKQARSYKLEGTVQAIAADKIRVIVCGEKEQVDYFIDAIHKEASTASVKDIEIEPYVKDRDYRGVFRVIE